MDQDQSVAIGDRIRISVPLAREWAELSDHVTVVMRLKEIKRDDTGALILYLERIEPTPAFGLPFAGAE